MLIKFFKMKLSVLRNFSLILIFFVFTQNSIAQCAMCRAVLETEESGIHAESINDGIVYLMAFPYILLAVVGWAIYRVMTKKKKS